MSGDFTFQLNYVKEQLPRMLALQDVNPISPSSGCFHYAYWRDKTSEFADTRFQEAGATIGMFAHEHLYSSNLPYSQEELLHRFSMGLSFWQKLQHKDGSFDEWYKYEHGFAATEFSIIAYGLAVYLLQGMLPQRDLDAFHAVGDKACKWLSKNNDFVKLNHQMASAAALAIYASLAESPRYMEAAHKKYNSVLARQTEEGWFNEINGMDLGYCSVLLDYAMLYQKFAGLSKGLDALQKLYRFLFNFIQPNLTISSEAGICFNPYFSRLGTLLLSPHCEEAATVVSELKRRSPGYSGIEPYLADDLRLCRWSYLPVLTSYYLETEFKDRTGVAKPLEEAQTPGVVYKPKANVLVHKQARSLATFMPVSGGGLRVVRQEGDHTFSYEDFGYQFKTEEGWMCGQGYDQERAVKKIDDHTFEVEVFFTAAKFMFPGFFSRLVLRVLGAIPGFPKYLRKGIDLYRKFNKTALNQSAAPVGKNDRDLRLTRQIKFSQEGIEIKDTLVHDKSSRYDIEAVKPIASLNNGKGVAQQQFSSHLGQRQLGKGDSLVLIKKLNWVGDNYELKVDGLPGSS